MTNREAYKDTLDIILAKAIAVVDGKPEPCATASCKRCLFLVNCREHGNEKDSLEWLNAEYQEPSVDWSKVPIDTQVLVSGDGKRWHRRYFAGVRYGNPEAYDEGATSWSVDNNRTCVWKYMKLAEGNE